MSTIIVYALVILFVAFIAGITGYLFGYYNPIKESSEAFEKRLVQAAKSLTKEHTMFTVKMLADELDVAPWRVERVIGTIKDIETNPAWVTPEAIAAYKYKW